MMQPTDQMSTLSVYPIPNITYKNREKSKQSWLAKRKRFNFWPSSVYGSRSFQLTRTDYWNQSRWTRLIDMNLPLKKRHALPSNGSIRRINNVRSAEKPARWARSPTFNQSNLTIRELNELMSLLALRYLGRTVVSGHYVWGHHESRPGCTGKSEVQYFQRAVRLHDDIARLQVLNKEWKKLLARNGISEVWLFYQSNWRNRNIDMISVPWHRLYMWKQKKKLASEEATLVSFNTSWLLLSENPYHHSPKNKPFIQEMPLKKPFLTGVSYCQIIT
jgi:hypothetical protein